MDKGIIPTILTIINALFGLLAIINSIEEEYSTAAVFLILAVLTDFLDGKIARKLGKESDFGKELDSLADIISFGVAPCVFAYTLGNIESISVFVMIIFLACGMIRLARFNITDNEYFVGMPITMNGLIIPVLYFIGAENYIVYAMLILAFLMVSPFKFPKLGRK